MQIHGLEPVQVTDDHPRRDAKGAAQRRTNVSKVAANAGLLFNRLERRGGLVLPATTLHHDPYGRLLYQSDPDTEGNIYTYNSFGELKTSLQGYTVLRTFNYDRLGRVTSAIDGSGSCTPPNRTGCTQWIYDLGASAFGQLSETISPPSAESPTGQHVLYAYEPTTTTSRRGLLKSLTYVIDGVSYTIGLQYDDLARAHEVSYPDLGSGAPIKAQYGYDALSGALTSLSEVGGNATRFIWSVSEAFQGQLPSSIQFGNGASSTIEYDLQRQFLDSIQTKLNGETIQNLGYQRYGNGQVHELSNIQGTQDNHFTYDYDSLGRLKQSRETFPGRPDAIQAYGYDVHGNLSSFAGTLIRYENAKPHLPTNVGTAAYTHDLNGHLTSRTGLGVPSSSQTFTYTPFDLPATITTGTTPERVTQFDYTADQQRVVRRDPDRTRHFVGDFYERVLSPSGATQEEHFRLSAGGGMVAEIIRTPAGDQTLYFHPDALGTPETLTDASGNVTRQAFNPFGTRRDGPTGPATRIGYTGHDQDDDLGLIDMGGRVYDPLAGRFTTADPIMQAPYWSQGQNRYAYVFNDPINMTDPSGFSADGAGVAGGAFIGELGLAGFANGGIQHLAASGMGWGAVGGLGGGAANVAGTLAGNPFGGSAGGTQSLAAPSGAASSSPVKPGGTNAVGQGSAPRVVQESGGLGRVLTNERYSVRYTGRGRTGVPGPRVWSLSQETKALLQPVFDGFVDLDQVQVEIRDLGLDKNGDQIWGQYEGGNTIVLDPQTFLNGRIETIGTIAHELVHVVHENVVGREAVDTIRWYELQTSGTSIYEFTGPGPKTIQEFRSTNFLSGPTLEAIARRVQTNVTYSLQYHP